MAPVWLIAERELRTYLATASFWMALAVGPLLMAGVLVLAGVGARASAPVVVSVSATDPALIHPAAAALAEAATTEGRRLRIVYGNAAPSLVLVRLGDGSEDLRFSEGFPLSPAGRALTAGALERARMLQQLQLAGMTAPSLRAAHVRLVAAPSPAKARDPVAPSRFALVMALWLILTGSLGMLLQAVVRERSNRALESLLAAARPWEIVGGKLIGVGAISGLVLVAWLGSGAALAWFGPGGSGVVQVMTMGMASAAVLARAGLVYALAFVFYGSVTVALGAIARDVAAAQNLSRPMFAILLAAFFAVLFTGLGGAPAAPWLLCLPPLTPFMLLLSPPGALSAPQEMAAFALLAVSAATAGRMAVRSVTLAGGFPLRWKPTRSVLASRP